MHRLMRCWIKLKNRPNLRFGIFLLFTLSTFFLTANPVFAEEPSGASSSGPSWYHSILEFFGYLFLQAAQGLVLLINLLFNVLVPIMTYNSFSTSPVVAAGWAIVRDTVNMFFVIILIIIALGTMFGWQKFKWQQQVPKLLLFAIVINFSKTITGILIDFGQVVMLTFANALQNIAAGNFIELFGLGQIYSFSKEQLSSGEVTTQAFDYFLAGAGAFIMTLIVLVTLIILVAILLFRIVTLWVLVVLSPLAFFLGGAKDVIGDKGYADWWKKFTCAVAIGPVLVFFLWLTLAVAGAGTNAATAGFTMSKTSSTGLINSIFELERFMGFIIGLGMIFAGFEAATSVCAGASGTMNKLVGSARGAAKGVAVAGPAAAGVLAVGAGRLGMRKGKQAAGATYRGTAGLVSDKLQGTPLDFATKRGRAKTYRNISKKTGSKHFSKITGGWADQIEKQTSKEVKEAGTKLSGASSDTKLGYLDNLATSGKPLLAGNKKEAMATFGDAIADKKLRSKLDASGNLGKLWKEYGEDMKEAFKGDPNMKKQIDDFEKSRPDIMARNDDGTIDTGKLAKLIDTTDDVRALDTEALANQEVKAHLEKLDSDKVNKDGTPKKFSQLFEEGAFGGAKKEAFEKGMSGIYSRMSDEDIGKVPVDRLASAVEKDPNSASLLSKKPEIGVRLMSESSDAARKSLRKDDATYNAAMKSGAGIDLNSGRVEDPDKFKNLLTSNPNIMGKMKHTDMDKGFIVEEMAKSISATQVKQVISQIKKDPNSDTSITARANMHKMLNNAMANPNVSGDDQSDMALLKSYFESQLKSMGPATPNPAPPGYASPQQAKQLAEVMEMAKYSKDQEET